MSIQNAAAEIASLEPLRIGFDLSDFANLNVTANRASHIRQEKTSLNAVP